MANQSPMSREEPAGEEPLPGVRRDALSGAAFVALGLFLAVASWRMPRLEHRDINPYTVPGLVPGVLGVILLVLGAVLLGRSLAAGRRLFARKERPGAAEGGIGSAGRLAVTLLLTVGYAAGLVGRIPFEWATFLFVFLFVLAFEWNRPSPDGENSYSWIRRVDAVFARAFGASAGARVKSAVAAAALAFGVALAVAYLFQDVFRIRLP